ncbi:MAG: DUF262 domain-containing protein [Salinivirgaceae bacterium]|nr:DUF262 domain-containing protein [Salinivirgaceae bacterium]
MNMLNSGDYNLNPEFQRRKRWSTTKQSRLVESFIMNVPIPPIFLYEVAYSQYEVMDGLQRLTAINEFYSNKFALTGLDQWSELNGMYYNTLPEQVRRGIDRRYLSSIILLQETARDEVEAIRLKQLVFERINSGGEKLEPQESRNALYNGPLNQLCIKLARTESFCKMWAIPTDADLEKLSSSTQASLEFDEDLEYDSEPEDILQNNAMYKKMQDVELVLRFFAYRQLSDVEQGRLRDFLDLYLKQGNLFSKAVLEKFSELFTKTSDLIYKVLGDRAFYLLRKKKNGAWQWFERPTKVLYDPLMYAFSCYLPQTEKLLSKSEEIKNKLEELYRSQADAFEGRSTNQRDIFTRRNLLKNFLGSVLE